jgi:hypothetical protein
MLPFPMFRARQLPAACQPLRATSVHSASAFTPARPGRYPFPLFSFSYALFCIAELTIASLLNKLHTLCTKQPGWGDAAFPPLSAQPFLRTRSKTRNSSSFMELLHDSRTPRGWGYRSRGAGRGMRLRGLSTRRPAPKPRHSQFASKPTARKPPSRRALGNTA